MDNRGRRNLPKPCNPFSIYADAFFLQSFRVTSRIDLTGEMVTPRSERESESDHCKDRTLLLAFNYAPSFTRQVRGFATVMSVGLVLHLILIFISKYVLNGSLFGIYWSAGLEILAFSFFALASIHSWAMAYYISRRKICAAFVSATCPDEPIVPKIHSSTTFEVYEHDSQGWTRSSGVMCAIFPIMTANRFLVETVSREGEDSKIMHIGLKRTLPIRSCEETSGILTISFRLG